MKHFYLIFLFFLILIVSQSSFSQNITIEKMSLVENKEQSYIASSIPNPELVEVFANYLKRGEWFMLKPYFEEENLYNEFLNYFVKDKNKTNILIYKNLKSYSVAIENKKLLIQLGNTNTIEISFTTKLKSGQLYISNFHIKEKSTNLRAAYDTSSYRYIRLPLKNNTSPEYYNNFQEAFLDNGMSIPTSDNTDIPFRQISFTPLKIKFKYCTKILGGFNYCGNKTKEFEFGGVLSDKDNPENTNANDYPYHYFDAISDMTAYAERLGSNELSVTGKDYSLTAIITDSKLRKITFYKEGVEPYPYGNTTYENTFFQAVAVKKIGDFIYVLDKGISGRHYPSIKVLKARSTISNDVGNPGSFEVQFIGSINAQNLGGFQMSNAKDIGGFESENTNILLLADYNGIHKIALNPITGLPVNGSVKTYYKAIDKITDRLLDLGNIRRIDSRKPKSAVDRGSTIIITNRNEIISFYNSEFFSENLGNYINVNFYTPCPQDYFPNNLAYMNAEEMWYLTDKTGKIHKLNKDGRYLGGGGNTGIGEWNNELYNPIALTPNPIEDTTNDYRYRYFVANEWGYETGLKLFSPGLMITDASIFEDAQNGNLNLTFATTGKWYHIENSKSVKFQGIKINGQYVNANIWNTNIPNSVISNPKQSFIDNTLEVISFNPNNFLNEIGNATQLKRGWNTVTYSIAVYGDTQGSNVIETISKSIDFYWLPTTFTPTLNSNQFNDFKMNNSNLNGLDIIYKPITINNQGVFYVNNTNLIISNYGNLKFNAGASLFNSNYSSQGISNFTFDGNGSIIFENESHICVNTKADNYSDSYQLPDLTKNFVLKSGYKLGLNPALFSLTQLPQEIANTCKSACEFLAGNAPKVVFVDSIDLASGPNFTVKLNTKGTTYYNQLKFEVAKINTATQTSNYAVATVNGLVESVNLKQLLNYNFESCSEYNVTVSIGCNGNSGSTNVEWIKSLTKKISTRPIVDAGKDEIVCESNPMVTLGGFKPSNGSWTGQGISNGVANFYTANVAKDINIPLTYAYTDSWGCTVTDEKIVLVRKTPLAPVVSTNSPLCAKKTATLSVDSIANARYIWQGPNNINITTPKATFNILQAQPAMSGEYMVKYEVDGCKGLPTSKQITILPLPTVTAGKDTLLCKMSSSIWLTTGKPQGGTAYWYGKGVGNYNFSPSFAGVGVHPLTYVYTDTNGCTNSAVRNITVGPVLTATNESVCANNPAYTLGGVTPTGGTWAGTAVTPAGVFTPASSPTGTQYLTYTATANGCSNSIVKQVTVKPTPAPPYLTAQPRETVCEGGTVTLAPSTIVTGNTYKITGPNGFVADRATTTLYNFTEPQKGLYTITATKDGCTNTPNANATRTLFFNPLPIVNAGIDEITCTYIPKLKLKNATPVGGSWAGEGYKRDTIMTNTIADNPTGPPSFSSGGAPPPPLIPKIQDVFLPTAKTQGRSYPLTYTYTHPTTGCTNSDTKEIKIGGNPTVRIETSNNDTTCGNSPGYTDLAAIAENSYEYRYQWYKNGNPIAGATGPVIRVTAPARYGCVVNASCGGGYADYEVKNTKEWIRLEGASNSTAGISSDKNLWMWGSNTPVGRPEDRGKPTLIDSSGNWKEVSLNIKDISLYALKENGTLWNFNRDRSENTIGITDVPPTQIGTDNDWQKIKGGTSNNTLGLKKNGTIWGWGRSTYGEAGALNSYFPSPNQIGSDTDWKDISTADGKFVGIKRDGSLWQWGLIINSTSNYRTAIPEKVDNSYDWDRVIGGYGICMAIKNDKSLWCWGSNAFGEAGTGDLGNKIDYPQRVTMDNDWKDVKLGYYHTIGLKENGEVWIWGANDGLGIDPWHIPTTNNYVYPVKTSLSDVYLIATGGEHTVVSKKCSMELCGSGDNSSGSLGIGSINNIYRGFSCLGTSASNPPIRRGNSNLYKSTSSTNYLLNPMPNPARGFTNIFYKIPLQKYSKLIIYDLVKENSIQEYILDNFQEDGHQFINTSNLINGVYMVSLEIDGEIVDTQKLIVLK